VKREIRVEAPAPPRLVTLRYLITPQADVPREVVVRCPPDCAFAEIGALLDEHARTPVPTASLANAIHRFAFIWPEAHRLTWKKEGMGPHVYHKLKRGAARMYIR